MTDLVELGAAKLDQRTGMVTAQCKGSSVEGGEAPDYGDVNLLFALGFASVPGPADDNGAAQGVLLDDAPGQDGVCVGAVDSRTTQTYYELGPGETAVFSTGKGFDSRILLKDGLVAITVGDDVVMVVDRKNKKVTTAAFGMVHDMSDANGHVLTDETGKASIQLKNGTIALTGNVVLGGRTPTMPFAASPGPVTGTVGATVPTQGVFWGR